MDDDDYFRAKQLSPEKKNYNINRTSLEMMKPPKFIVSEEQLSLEELELIGDETVKNLEDKNIRNVLSPVRSVFI